MKLTVLILISFICYCFSAPLDLFSTNSTYFATESIAPEYGKIITKQSDVVNGRVVFFNSSDGDCIPKVDVNRKVRCSPVFFFVDVFFSLHSSLRLY
jgi:hypothetical protein